MKRREYLNKLQEDQTEKTISMLEELLKRIKKGELIPTSHGFWLNNLDKSISFKVIVQTEDDQKESQVFDRIH